MRLNRTHVTEAPVGPTLIRLALPMVGGMLAMMLFNVVDTFFIGQLGAQPLAAIGFTFPVVFIVTGATMGMGIGMASMVSRAVGEGDHHEVAALTTNGLVFVIFLVLCFVALGLVLHDRIFALLGADEALIAMIRHYMYPWFLGVPFLVLPMIGNSALRATGDSFTPSLIMLIAGGVNVILDPLLIFGIGPFPRLELQGAALATVFSYFITFAAASWILIRREKMILFERPTFPALMDTWARLLHVGLPAVMTNMLIPLSSGILTRIMASYGTQAVAAFGVGTRIESLVMVGHFSLTTIMIPFAGQNFGAGRPERVREGLQFGLKYCIVLSLLIWLPLWFGADLIAGWFTKDEVIIEIIRPFLRWVPLSYGGFGYALLVTASFNGAGLPRHAMTLFGARLFLFTVPLAVLGSYVADIPGVFAAMFVSNIGAGLLAHHMAKRHPKWA